MSARDKVDVGKRQNNKKENQYFQSGLTLGPPRGNPDF